MGLETDQGAVVKEKAVEPERRKENTPLLAPRFPAGDWLTSKQAAGYLGMSTRTFLRRVKAFPTLLPYEKPTNVFRFRRSDIEAFSQAAKQPPQQV